MSRNQRRYRESGVRARFRQVNATTGAGGPGFGRPANSPQAMRETMGKDDTDSETGAVRDGADAWSAARYRTHAAFVPALGRDAVALIAVLGRRGIDGTTAIPWFFPTAEAYRRRLRRFAFEVTFIELFPRPTPLPGEMSGWLETLAAPVFGVLPPGERAAARDEAVALLCPALCDESGRWTADYVRLRFAAHRNS